ncbi:MAG: phosphatase PAP2 family protein [Halodesulfurarchaeum sp.]
MLVDVVVRLVAIVGVLLAVSLYVVVGRNRIVRPTSAYRDRLFDVAPYTFVLAFVLVANKIARDVGPQVSWLFGWNVTSYLYWVDARLLWPVFPNDPPQVVVFLQSLGTPQLTAYFSFVYVYGYVLLLVFPLLAYFLLESPRPLRRTIVAYAANYVVGVACYVVFIAYGPRNNAIGEGLLYTTYAEYSFLTSAINVNVNVFPSLHTSLAVTVALLAWTTRDEYTLWVPVAGLLAGSVVFSTMYLGIHWAADVVAGVLLAWASVRIGQRYEEHRPDVDWVRRRLNDVNPARGR